MIKLDAAGKRWKHEALFEQGFRDGATFFLRHYARLRPFSLTHGEATFMLHLMQCKWDKDFTFPSYRTIAAQMGVSAKQAQRHAVNLEGKGYLKREQRTGTSNRFDLRPLFDALHAVMVATTRKADVVA